MYQAAPARPVQDKKLVQVWLTEAALLTSRVHTGVLLRLAQAPALFPFHLASLYAVDLAGHSRLEPFCHGLNEDIVRFREQGRMLQSPPCIAPRRNTLAHLLCTAESPLDSLGVPHRYTRQGDHIAGREQRS